MSRRSKSGYVYIISNKNFPNHYKIGVTTDIERRLQNYQTSSPFRDYKIEYYISHPDCYHAEKLIEKQMKHFALSQKNEWYEISLELAKQRLDESLEEEKIDIDFYTK